MIKGNVIASKLLDDNTEIGEKVSVQLPSFTQVTSTINLPGGEADLPTTGRFSGAEVAVNTRGLSRERARLARPGVHKLELRFAQDSYSVQEGMIPEGCKIFMTCVYKSDDIGSIEDGGSNDGSVTYEALRYEEFIDGKPTRLIDKRTGQNINNGTDYSEKIRSILG